jgi:predicted  nucleic acid-binding Zn-ribbon protein
VQDSLRQLVELHRLDEELHQVEEATDALPGQRADIDATEAQVREKLEQAQELLRQLQQEQRLEETSLQDHETQKTRFEGQQSQVKSNEAYTALLHEIETASEAISRSETRILELMEAVEKASRGLRAAQEESRQTEAELGRRRLALDAKEEQLSKERTRLEATRANLAAAVEREPLARYERIAERRRPAIALVSGELCLGCRVGIPPQLYVEVLSGKSLVTCGTCHRILIHERLLGGEQTGTDGHA